MIQIVLAFLQPNGTAITGGPPEVYTIALKIIGLLLFVLATLISVMYWDIRRMHTATHTLVATTRQEMRQGDKDLDGKLTTVKDDLQEQISGVKERTSVLEVKLEGA